MTTKLKTLIEEIREETDDLNQDILSEYSLLKTYNNVQSLVGNRLIALKSLLITKRMGLTLINGVCNLPKDFQNVVKITDEETENTEQPGESRLTISSINDFGDEIVVKYNDGSSITWSILRNESGEISKVTNTNGETISINTGNAEE